MILFGGGNPDGTFSNEVWALDLTEGNEHWTRLFPTGTIPLARAGFTYGYDSNRNKLYICGGWNYMVGCLFNDAFVLDIPSLTWTQINGTGDGPCARRNLCGTYDYFNDNLIIYGGDLGPGSGTYLGDCYILDIDNFTSYQEWNSTISQNVTPTIFVNAANRLVQIRYILPEPIKLKVDIIDINGRIVNNLFSGMSEISAVLSWDKKDSFNREVSAGSYFCRLETEDMSIAKKFVIIK